MTTDDYGTLRNVEGLVDTLGFHERAFDHIAVHGPAEMRALADDAASIAARAKHLSDRATGHRADGALPRPGRRSRGRAGQVPRPGRRTGNWQPFMDDDVLVEVPDAE